MKTKNLQSISSRAQNSKNLETYYTMLKIHPVIQKTKRPHIIHWFLSSTSKIINMGSSLSKYSLYIHDNKHQIQHDLRPPPKFSCVPNISIQSSLTIATLQYSFLSYQSLKAHFTIFFSYIPRLKVHTNWFLTEWVEILIHYLPNRAKELFILIHNHY